MRVRERSIVCELLRDKLGDYLSLMRSIIESNAFKSTVLVLKPSIIPVILRGCVSSGKKFLTFPPFSFIVEPSEDVSRGSDIVDVITNSVSEGALRCFEVAEDVWIEGKYLLATGSRNVECLGSGPLVKLAQELGLTCSGESSVIIADELSSISNYEEKILGRRHVVNALGLRDAVVEEVTGRPYYYWSTHPLLYGLTDALEVKVKLVPLRIFKKLSLLGKPLLFIDGRPLIVELSYNNSIVFLGFNDCLTEIALRAILYVV
ncbi:MAG: hypothetical protein J7L12_02525 [Desulfurococcales archaeon]|nr:hypothetical protein [Desulfurococcales archaeon]